MLTTQYVTTFHFISSFCCSVFVFTVNGQKKDFTRVSLSTVDARLKSDEIANTTDQKHEELQFRH